MAAFGIILALALAQAEPSAPEAPAADPAPAPAAAPAPSAPAKAAPKAPAAGQTLFHGPSSPEEVARQLERIRRMDPDQAAEAVQDITDRLRARGSDFGNEPEHAGFEFSEAARLRMQTLPELEQVRTMARMFMTQLIAGDARGVTQLAGFPFQLEDRKLTTPEELHREWLKNLRPKRTDLLSLYDVEILSPSEMEKKYGRPPARVAALPWRAPNTYVAVANVSGHAAVLVLRQYGVNWQVVGYTD